MSSQPPELGTQSVQVSHKDGLVVLHFEKPVSWCALDPQTAKAAAEAIARTSYAAIFGDGPTPTAKSQITEQLRLRLRNRVAHMLRSMAKDVPMPEFEIQATRIVDECLKEVA